MSPPPPFPYAPRRSRPLSLWNPLDYLVLLYWVFYFPQALRWYMETFSKLPADIKGWQAVRQDAVQRRLALQGLLVLIVTVLFSLFSKLVVVVPVAVVAFVMAFDMAGSMEFGMAFGIAGSVVVGVVAGVVIGVEGFVEKGLMNGVMVGVVAGVMFGMVFGVMVRVVAAAGLVASMANYRVFGVVPGVVVGVTIGVVFGVLVGVADGVVVGVKAGVMSGMVVGVAMLRLDAALLGLLPALLQPSKQFAITLQRVSPLPIWGLHRRLIRQLMEKLESRAKQLRGTFTLQSAIQSRDRRYSRSAAKHIGCAVVIPRC